MCIFPEGKRSVTGRLDVPKAGVFHLSRECSAPLVPVYLKGVNGLFSCTNPGFHLTKLSAEILPPLEVKNDIETMKNDWYESLKPFNDTEYSKEVSDE